MNYNRKIAFHTLGCKLNFAETSSIARAFEENGFARVDFAEIADVYVINTCSVTENANKKCRSLIRQTKRRAAESIIIVTGCYAQLKPDEISEIPGVDLVLGAAEKFEAIRFLEKFDRKHGTKAFASEIKDLDFFTAAYSFGDRTRTFLKVQDGCDYHCSFCTIPLARGRSRSQTIANTLISAREAAATGVKEIVLTGVNIGDFGKSPDGRKRTDETLLGLIEELNRLDVERWRISSIEPNLLTEEIIDFVASDNSFMPHFHLPLQSGSDKVLKRMRRKYLRSLYAKRVEQIKSKIPDCCIGVDVITGFPSETEADFLETYKFLQELDVSYLHVFTYSERPDTLAAKMEQVVPVEERRERSNMLRTLSVKKKRAFYNRFLNTVRPVLMEELDDDGLMYGFTDNYIKVQMPHSPDLVNEIVNARIKRITPLSCAEIELVPESQSLYV